QSARVAKLAREEAWAWVEGVVLRNATALQLRRLRDNPALAEVASLTWPRLGSTRLEPPVLQELLQASWLSGLRELGLDGAYWLGDKEVTAVARTPTLAGLRWLSLAGTEAGPKGLRAVLASPHLQGLTRLELAASLEELAGVDRLPSLRHLTLGV